VSAQRWVVLTREGNYWENVWTVDDEPEIFDSYADAEAELAEHLRECRWAVDEGDMTDAPTRDAFRISPHCGGVDTCHIWD